jgi:hypothetical protein
MPYTFYHAGVLIGESKLEDVTSKRQRAGVFRPTPYGLDIFPRLTGILSAGHALETHLRENGLSLDDMEKAEIEHLLDTNPAGQKIIDIGRMLSEVEIQAPNGTRKEFEQIAFIDQLEWKRVGKLLSDPEAEVAIEEWPPGVPRYVVSVTLRKSSSFSSRDRTPVPIRSH